MHREAWGVNGGGILYQSKHVNNSKVIPKLYINKKQSWSLNAHITDYS